MAIHGYLDPQRTHYLDWELCRRDQNGLSDQMVQDIISSIRNRSVGSPLTVRVACEETRSAVNLISPACSGLTDLKNRV